MADFGADIDLEAFRKEAREWLEANFPASLKGKSALASAEVRSNEPDLVKWRKAMGDKGWGTPTWPTEYGGGGLTPQQARVLGQEMTKVGAFNPLMFGMGVTMIGPTIMDYGTEEQKKKHLPPIVKGEVQWCVGYSEP
ncbi:MAG: acyl-CoA dehydrogenase, partial [Phenylobacterium sp.]|uniref:acyl-CoA dehydrogenase family protein n=1 Tax=Phenylobacterium sp. TaxID=1871053 RepID=UPI0025DEDA3C